MLLRQPKLRKILTARKLKAVDEYISAYVKFYPNKVDKIILFGSQARKKARPDSDLDLLMVANMADSQLRPLSPLWQKAVSLADEIDYKYNYRIGISPKLISKNYFNKWSPFMQNVWREGLALWERKK